jgi:hypothetical protein
MLSHCGLLLGEALYTRLAVVRVDVFTIFIVFSDQLNHHFSYLVKVQLFDCQKEDVRGAVNAACSRDQVDTRAFRNYRKVNLHYKVYFSVNIKIRVYISYIRGCAR